MNALGTIGLGLILLPAIAFAALAWVAYHVIKAAIRDGIRESGLLAANLTAGRRPAPRTDLPDMHADR